VADLEKLWTVDEVAAYLQINQQSVRSDIERGTLRVTRIGQRRVRIRQAELERFVAAPDSNTDDDPAELSSALAVAAGATDPTELAAALPAVAAAAERPASAPGG
jgi:excisionase family DNA binding protein